MTDASKNKGHLQDIRVLEIGSRIATGVCGSLLAEAGATVIMIDQPVVSERPQDKWMARPVFATGKHSVVADVVSEKPSITTRELFGNVDVVLLSSDIDGMPADELMAIAKSSAIVCDFTAFGKTGSRAGATFNDAMIQALSGVAHTTGFVDGPPVTTRVPIVEYSTGVYGAAAVVAALMERDHSSIVQQIDMALFDCALNAMATFLPAHFVGGNPARVGNQHAMCAPWNSYQANDGWVLICAASDPPWRRLCAVMGRAELGEDPDFATLSARMENRPAVDKAVQDWISHYSVKDSLNKLMAADIACGPILPLASNDEDANLQHREMFHMAHDPITSTEVRLPGGLLKSSVPRAKMDASIPAPNEAASAIAKLLKSDDRTNADTVSGEQPGTRLPLTGVRVLEIGQYTTAPLTSRHLATLGAEVLKIEPPGGDAARDWLPHNGGKGYFFIMSNAGKESLAVDLGSEDGRQLFTKMVASADVLVENLKPGSLARRGFPQETLERINPGLIYCAISGFGDDSTYGERPAFDTVVQAMSGLMDANAFAGTPLKAGISAADFMGGEIALFGLLAALRNRDQSKTSEYLDLSMQDVAMWMTAILWDGRGELVPATRMVECNDGYLLITGEADKLRTLDETANAAGQCSREDLLSKLSADGWRCAPVQSVGEAVDDPQTVARELLLKQHDEQGLVWPLLASPLRMSRTRPHVDGLIDAPRPVDDTVLQELGIQP